MSNNFDDENQNNPELESSFLRSVHEQIGHMQEREVVPPIFRLGKTAASEEVVIDGIRLLTWDLTGQEKDVAKIANWQKFMVDIDEETNSGTLLIPEGTRNAKSVLSGKEAWEGEKATLVKAVAGYINQVDRELEGYDVMLAWNNVGVTPEHKFFIAPPNVVMKLDPKDLAARKFDLVSTLGKLLRGDEENADLIEQFDAEIRGEDDGNQ